TKAGPAGQAVHPVRACRPARACEPAGQVTRAVQRSRQAQGPRARQVPRHLARHGRGGKQVGGPEAQLRGGAMTARRLLLGIAVAACALAASAGAARGDFRDGTIFSDTATNGRLDVGPLFVFRSPANANNTVFVMTVSPFTGVLTPATFVKGARYHIAIDTTGHLVEDSGRRAPFGRP